jgi:hypothetical protein
MSDGQKRLYAADPAGRSKQLSDSRTKALLANPFEWKNRRTYSNEKSFMAEADEMGIVYEKDRLRSGYVFEGAKKVYVPDFFLPEHNMVVETKSWYWLRKQGIKLNEAKLAACLDKGYEVVMIIDGVAVFHNGWLLAPSQFPL